jgi:hypothetical protein
MYESLSSNVSRLLESGADIEFVLSILYQIRIKTNSSEFHTKTVRQEWELRPTAVIPYIHKVSHSLRRIADGLDTQVSFEFENKNKTLPVIFESESFSSQCSREHSEVNASIECEKNVVYALELTCGAKYIGETERCVKTRLAEHTGNLTKMKKSQELEEPDLSQYSKITSHTKNCSDQMNCTIDEEETKVLKSKLWNKTARRLVEGYHIANEPLNVSKPILEPTSAELLYMAKHNLI